MMSSKVFKNFAYDSKILKKQYYLSDIEMWECVHLSDYLFIYLFIYYL